MSHQNDVISYYQTAESRLGYSIGLKGVKHFGYYPGNKGGISMAHAQRLMNDQLAQRLHLPTGSCVLDAGCGEGGVARYLAKAYGFKVSGVDLLDFNITKARQMVNKEGLEQNVDVQVADYTKLPFADETFDAVYTMETLVHAGNYQQALCEFWRVLKPGGRLVLFEYTLAPEKDLSDREKKKLEQVISGSAMDGLRYFRHDTFKSLIEKEGFGVDSMDDISSHILPMLRIFHYVALVPYTIACLFGWEEHLVNGMAGVEGYRMFASGAWRYYIVTAHKV